MLVDNKIDNFGFGDKKLIALFSLLLPSIASPFMSQTSSARWAWNTDTVALPLRLCCRLGLLTSAELRAGGVGRSIGGVLGEANSSSISKDSDAAGNGSAPYKMHRASMNEGRVIARIKRIDIA